MKNDRFKLGDKIVFKWNYEIDWGTIEKVCGNGVYELRSKLFEFFGEQCTRTMEEEQMFKTCNELLIKEIFI